MAVEEEDLATEEDLGAAEEVGAEDPEVIYVDLDAGAIMGDGGDNLFFGGRGITGHDGLNFGLYLVIASVVAHLMVVQYQELVPMIVFGLLIATAAAMFIMVEHKKKHYEHKKGTNKKYFL